MDFELALMISGLTAGLFAAIGLAIFSKRLRDIYDQLNAPTKFSLIYFSLAAIPLIAIPIVAYIDKRLIVNASMLVLTLLLLSELSLIVKTEKKMKQAKNIIIMIAIVGLLDSLIYTYILPITRIPFIISMALFSILSLALAIYLVKESPNPFTASLLSVLILFFLAYLIGSSGIMTTNPEYYLLDIASFVVIAAILASLLRPWRYIITLSILFFSLNFGIASSVAAFASGEFEILVFSMLASFAGISTVFPLDFFIEQYTETKAVTPIYISITLFSIGLLVVTHASNFAIYKSSAGVWDENILFIDWFFGILAVSAFLMAAISATSSYRVRTISREIIIAVGFTLLTLGHPFVRLERTSPYSLNLLYPFLMILILIALIQFSRLSFKLHRLGSTRAGARFVIFMLSALFLGLVTMFADLLPLDILAVLMISGGIGMLVSSPKTRIAR